MTYKEAETLLKPGERLDDLQRNGYQIIQDTGRFCFGMDAVLLTGFVRIKSGERVLDMGTGTGIIPILLEAKTKAAHFTALEIQADSADMADRSVKINGLEDKIGEAEHRRLVNKYFFDSGIVEMPEKLAEELGIEE